MALKVSVLAFLAATTTSSGVLAHFASPYVPHHAHPHAEPPMAMADKPAMEKMDMMDMEEMMDKPMMASKLHKEHPLPEVRATTT